jgi:hypothetical protein
MLFLDLHEGVDDDDMPMTTSSFKNAVGSLVTLGVLEPQRRWHDRDVRLG